MCEISQEIALAAEHRLRSSERHRHSWRIKAVVQATELDRNGWVIDFNELTRVVGKTLAPYDNAYLNEIAPFDDIEPTREIIARVFADRLAETLDDGRIKVARVEIWEGETRCTTFFR